MRIEMVSGLLLPAGVWLILSAGAPLTAQRRLASATLIALATALLAYAAFGFALMYGGIGATTPEFAGTLNAPIAIQGAQDTWFFAGATGFLVSASAQPAVLALFVQALPLVLTCAVLLAGVLAQRACPLAQFLLIVIVCGSVLPLAGGWLWANGWLHMLGASDLSRLSVVGLVAGGAGLAWLVATPRRENPPTAQIARLPEAQLPARAIAGVLLTLTGMAGALMATDADAALRQFMNTAIAIATAIIIAGAYTAFTTREADTLSASRAMLAAIFMGSAGAAALPFWLMALMGALCGLLATLGFYWVNERRRLHDDSAIVTTALLPAAAGMLIAGAIGSAAGFIAQTIAVAVMALLAFGLVRMALWVAQALRWPVLAAPQVAVATAMAEPAEPVPAIAAMDAPAAIEMSEAEALPPAQDAMPQRPRGLLERLRRDPAPDAAPAQPRKVAYPYRPGGRRMAARPIDNDKPPADSTPTIDAS